MLLLDLRELFEQVFQLRVVGAGGVAAVFVHAQLLLIFEILEQTGFFWRRLHYDHLTGSMPTGARVRIHRREKYSGVRVKNRV
ncbi:MAG: hypothetical protein ACLUNO_02015 [Oscillospiraceae bacterium]